MFNPVYIQTQHAIPYEKKLQEISPNLLTFLMGKSLMTSHLGDK
jgi:hypothetical protein